MLHGTEPSPAPGLVRALFPVAAYPTVARGRVREDYTWVLAHSMSLERLCAL